MKAPAPWPRRTNAQASLEMPLILSWPGLSMRKLGLFLFPEAAPSSASCGETLPRQMSPATRHPPPSDNREHRPHFYQESREGLTFQCAEHKARLILEILNHLKGKKRDMLFSMVSSQHCKPGGTAEAAQSVLCEQEGGRATPGSSDLRMPTGTRQVSKR